MAQLDQVVQIFSKNTVGSLGGQPERAGLKLSILGYSKPVGGWSPVRSHSLPSHSGLYRSSLLSGKAASNPRPTLTIWTFPFSSPTYTPIPTYCIHTHTRTHARVCVHVCVLIACVGWLGVWMWPSECLKTTLVSFILVFITSSTSVR
jgi:hypothetical protein